LSKLCADTILINGKIITVDKNNSIVEALAILDNKFVAVGDTYDIKNLVGPRTEILNLKGKTVMPGIIDSHTHPSNISFKFMEIDCRSPPISSITEILKMIKAKADKVGAGKWVRGVAFNDSKLIEKRHITSGNWTMLLQIIQFLFYLIQDTSHCLIVRHLKSPASTKIHVILWEEKSREMRKEYQLVYCMKMLLD
jgi:predicted amidohydrolase YtcJ